MAEDVKFYMKNKQSMPGISIPVRTRRSKTRGVIIGSSTDRWSFPAFRVLWKTATREWTSWHSPSNLIFIVKAKSRKVS